ncbi:MAG TPA: universal stress protein [Kribbella sp.]|nr:universal stress protein [Kribbella sp.]
MSGQPRPSVVVGVDGSLDGWIALEWAARHATLRHLELRGVHVVDESRPAQPLGSSPGQDDGTEVLEDAADELARIGYQGAKLEIRYGNPAEVLLDLSRDASLLVIGRRGAGGFAELVLGSTSQVCAALVRTALVVVPDTWRPDEPDRGRIVVGVDGSPSCQAALAFGFALASTRRAELEVVHVSDVPEAFPRPDVWLDPDEPPWRAGAELLVAEALANWTEKYPEVVVRTRFCAGHPVQVLGRASHTADLVVVGGLGRTRFSPLRMGSVARGLLHHSRSPVAVVHNEEQV